MSSVSLNKTFHSFRYSDMDREHEQNERAYDCRQQGERLHVGDFLPRSQQVQDDHPRQGHHSLVLTQGVRYCSYVERCQSYSEWKESTGRLLVQSLPFLKS